MMGIFWSSPANVIESGRSINISNHTDISSFLFSFHLFMFHIFLSFLLPISNVVFLG